MKYLDLLVQRIRIRQAAPFVIGASRVLDIGCADGALLNQVPGIGSYVGIDPDAPLSSERPGITFVRQAFSTLALPIDDKFDAIVALAVLEHVPRNRQLQFAMDCATLLAPAGRIVLTVPSQLVDPILEVLLRFRLIDGMKKEEHFGFNPADTPRLFTQSGLQLELHRQFECGLNHLFVFTNG